MSEQLTPLSPEEFVSFRTQLIALESAREQFDLQKSSTNETPGFDSQEYTEMRRIADDMPIHRLSLADIALSKSLDELSADNSGIGDSDFEREYTQSLLDEVSGLVGLVGKPWPITILGNTLEESDINSGEEHVEPIHENLDSLLPPLSPGLKRARSEHLAYKGRIKNVKSVLDQRKTFPYRSLQRQASDELALRCLKLERIFLHDPEDTTYREYYTEHEITELTDRLYEAYWKKNDQEFIDQLLDRAKPVASKRPHYYERDEDYLLATEDDLVPFFDEPNIDEYDWDPIDDEEEFLESSAEIFRQASVHIRKYMLAGGSRNIHRKNYLLTVVDPEDRDSTNPYNALFQFICDEFALETVGSMRQSITNSELRNSCMENVGLINEWFKQNKETIDQLPEEFFVEQSSIGQKSQVAKLRDKLPAKKLISHLISIMNARLQSGEDDGVLVGFEKSPHSMYGLQIAIAITIEQINRDFGNFESTSHITDIEPL